MPRLTPCPSCHAHRFVDERACPHCGAALPRSGSGRVAAVVVGLTLGGCIIPQPAYGIPDPTEGFGSTGTAGTEGETDSSGSATETGTSGSDDTSTGMADDTSTGMADDTSTGTDGTAGSDDTASTDDTAGSSGPEPAYGVAGTTSD